MPLIRINAAHVGSNHAGASVPAVGGPRHRWRTVLKFTGPGRRVIV